MSESKNHAPVTKLQVDAILQQILRDTFEALCALRDSINEYTPIPSLESDLLEGPETSVFCSVVAEYVISALQRNRLSVLEEAARVAERVCDEEEGSHIAAARAIRDLANADPDTTSTSPSTPDMEEVSHG